MIHHLHQHQAFNLPTHAELSYQLNFVTADSPDSNSAWNCFHIWHASAGFSILKQQTHAYWFSDTDQDSGSSSKLQFWKHFGLSEKLAEEIWFLVEGGDLKLEGEGLGNWACGLCVGGECRKVWARQGLGCRGRWHRKELEMCRSSSLCWRLCKTFWDGVPPRGRILLILRNGFLLLLSEFVLSGNSCSLGIFIWTEVWIPWVSVCLQAIRSWEESLQMEMWYSQLHGWWG